MKKETIGKLIDYIYKSSITFEGRKEDIPLDTSLVDEGIIDSYGVIELVAFIENYWGISIEPEDFTRKKMGSINLMAKLIERKI